SARHGILQIRVESAALASVLPHPSGHSFAKLRSDNAVEMAGALNGHNRPLRAGFLERSHVQPLDRIAVANKDLDRPFGLLQLVLGYSQLADGTDESRRSAAAFAGG